MNRVIRLSTVLATAFLLVGCTTTAAPQGTPQTSTSPEAAPTASATPSTVASSDDPGGPQYHVPSWVDVSAEVDSFYTEDIASSLGGHGEDINSGNYHDAWRQFTPAMQERLGGLDKWRSGVETSKWSYIRIESIESDGPEATVKAFLRTEQPAEAGYEGQTCSIHDMTYTMHATELDGYLIDRAERPNPPVVCPQR